MPRQKRQSQTVKLKEVRKGGLFTLPWIGIKGKLIRCGVSSATVELDRSTMKNYNDNGELVESKGYKKETWALNTLVEIN